MKCCLKLLLVASATALQPPQGWKALAKKALAPALLSAGCLSSTFAPPANAADKRQIASITASGLVFKDKLIVDAFADPKVEGVTLYVSDFERPVVERVQKDFFSDPSRGAAQTNHPHAIDATSLLVPAGRAASRARAARRRSRSATSTPAPRARTSSRRRRACCSRRCV